MKNDYESEDALLSDITEKPAWLVYLMENPVATAEEIRKFEHDFPDTKGEVIFMMKARLYGWMGL